MWKADRKKPELLAPAGDMERLQNGGGLRGGRGLSGRAPTFGMRAFAGNFDEHTIERRRRPPLPGAAGVRTHVHHATPCPATTRWPGCPSGWRFCRMLGVDALIVADLGALPAGGEIRPQAGAPHLHPGQRLQLPVTARAWYELGAKRVILARELSPGGSGGHPRATPPPSWSSRPLSTAPCASAIPAAACCPTT